MTIIVFQTGYVYFCVFCIFFTQKDTQKINMTLIDQNSIDLEKGDYENDTESDHNGEISRDIQEIDESNCVKHSKVKTCLLYIRETLEGLLLVFLTVVLLYLFSMLSLYYVRLIVHILL